MELKARFFQLIFFCGVLLGLLVNCRPKNLEKEVPEVNLVKQGCKFRINLAEKPNLGETWLLKDAFDSKIVDHISTIWHGREKGLDFNFVAADTGQAKLHFFLIKYRDTLDVKTYIVKIRD